MRVARTQKGLTHRNTLVLRRLKLWFQRFPGKHGTDADRGIAGADFVVRVEGRVVDKGQTGADGLVELLVPTGARAELEVFGTRYDLSLHPTLEPDTEVTGQQRRLSMLGYELGTIDGVVGRRTDRATLNFQADQTLDADGVVGANTRARLVNQFGE